MAPIFNISCKNPGMHVWSKFGISAQICDEFSCVQDKFYKQTVRRMDVWADNQTDGETEATTIPFWLERPMGKITDVRIQYDRW